MRNRDTPRRGPCAAENPCKHASSFFGHTHKFVTEPTCQDILCIRKSRPARMTATVMALGRPRSTAPSRIASSSTGSPRNLFQAPGFWNTDIGLVKVFQLTERFKLQFRTEIFNLFNTVNFDNPVTNINGANFGRITSITGRIPAEAAPEVVAPEAVVAAVDSTPEVVSPVAPETVAPETAAAVAKTAEFRECSESFRQFTDDCMKGKLTGSEAIREFNRVFRCYEESAAQAQAAAKRNAAEAAQKGLDEAKDAGIDPADLSGSGPTPHKFVGFGVDDVDEKRTGEPRIDLGFRLLPGFSHVAGIG